MSETACPFCGHSPVPERAEQCPRCDREFAKANLDETGVTRTRLGALTGAVTANPTPTAVAMFVGAAWWLLRGTGWLGIEEPWWVLVLSVLHVGAAVAVLSNLGPAHHFPSLVAVVGAGVGLVLSPGHPVLTSAAVAYAVAVIAQTSGDPGAVRLWGGAVLATAACLTGVGSLLGPAIMSPAAQVSAGAFTLTLPKGWREVPASAVEPLTVPVATRSRGVATFEATHDAVLGFPAGGDRTQAQAFGVLVAPTGRVEGPLSRCEEVLKLLGAPVTGARAGLVPPSAFGADADYFDVTLEEKLPARVACADRSDGPLLLIVSSREVEQQGAAAAFESVAGGLHRR